MKLNTEKIKAELTRIERNPSWLAKKMGMSRQALSYHLKYGSKSLATIDKIAEALGITAKDLIR